MRRRPRQLVPATVVVGAASILAACADGGSPMDQPSSSSSTHASTRPGAATTTPDATPSTSGVTSASSTSLATLSVPAVGLVHDVVAVRADPKSIPVPASTSTIAQLTRTASSTDASGTTVLAVRRSSDGPLSGLEQLTPGATLVLVGRDGVRTRWQVEEVKEQTAAQIPVELFVPTAVKQLVLVLGEGEQVDTRGHTFPERALVVRAPAAADGEPDRETNGG